tara:strand:+ start:237 stop:482 length:246 start_codon:yes stop_codon:yes gene_type:complete
MLDESLAIFPLPLKILTPNLGALGKSSTGLSEKQILNRLHELGRPEAIAKMLHFPIDTENTLGFACPICAAEPSESAAIIT